MDKTNFAKNLAVIVKGFIAMVMQIILIREFLIIFSGNELSLGIILACWLFLEALGSGMLAKIFSKCRENIKIYIILQFLIILSLPLTIWLVRTTKSNLGIFYGEVVTIAQMFFISFTTLFLFSVLDGVQFFFACRLFSGKTEAQSITTAYILEAAGMLLGGVIFTYVFLPLFNSFQIAFLLAFLSIISLLFLCFVSRFDNKKIIEGLLIFLLSLNLFVFLTGKIDLLQSLSLKKQFPRQEILDYKNSFYGNVAVTKEESQLTFFLNGVPAIVVPVTDITLAEEFTHLTLLYHPLPEEILLISSGAGGILNEILKEPVKKIDYAELDPLIIREIKKFSTPLTIKELSNRRVNLLYQDGRGIINNSRKKYDVIFINLTSPTTLQINRLFTQEFYKRAKDSLSINGIISLRLPGSLTYLNDELRQLNSSLYQTLSSVYKYVWVIPGDFNLFLASDSLDFENVTLTEIISRFKERNLKTKLLTEFSLNYRLDKSWRQWFFAQINDVRKTENLNQDFSPRGLFFALAFLYSLISPQTKNIFAICAKLKLFYLVIMLSVVFLILISLNKKIRKPQGLNLSLLILVSGFLGISSELILILGFQVLYGFIYAWVGILSAAFMLGLSTGGLIINKRLEKLKNYFSQFLKFEFAIIAFSLIMPFLLIMFSKINPGLTVNLIKPVFFTLSLGCGFLFGAEFPLANKIYFLNQEVKAANSSLYAFDLAGACLGAMISAVVLIPVLGILQTGVFLSFLKLLALIAFVLAAGKEAV